MIEEHTRKIRNALSKYAKINYAFCLFGSVPEKKPETSEVTLLLGANLNPLEKIDLAVELEIILNKKVDLLLVKDAPCEFVVKAFLKGKPVLINNQQHLKSDYFKNINLYENSIVA